MSPNLSVFPWKNTTPVFKVCHCHITPGAVLIICVKERNQNKFTFVARQSLNYKFGPLGFRTYLFEKFIILFWVPVDL